MNLKNFFVAGLAALLVMGLVYAAGFSSLGKRGGGCPVTDEIKEGLGLDEDATHSEVMDAIRNNRLTDLGLTKNATHKEIREALFEEDLDELGLSWDSTVRELFDAQNERRQLMRGERLPVIKERLGLSEDATEEDVNAAIKESKGAGFRGHHMGRSHGSRMMGFPSV